MSRTKSSLPLILLFIIILSFTIVCSILYNFGFLYATSNTQNQINIVFSNEFLPAKVDDGFSSNTMIIEENIEESSTKDPDLIPPINVTKEERIEWFKKKLPEFEIFKSTKLTRQFSERAQKFFNNGCKVRFFMIWISPARDFSEKEFFALETLFKSHPNECLMILSSTMDSKIGDRILKPFIERGFKILAVAPDVPFLLKNTPAEAWFDEMKKANRDPGEIPLAQNLSNLLRLAILYKYGGIYLDTDFIVINKLSNLKNTIGAQSMDVKSKKWSRLNNAVMIFDKKHPLLFKFMEEFSLTFDGNKWGHNGPYLVSRVMERVEKRPGYNVTVLPPMAFYPVDWNKISEFLKKPKNLDELKRVKAKMVQLSREAYGVHLWNSQSKTLRIDEESVIGRLIDDHCVICEGKYLD